MDSSLRKRSLVSKSSSILPVAPVNRADDLFGASRVARDASATDNLPGRDGGTHRDLFESESSNDGSDVCSWHFATVRCDAPIRSLLDGKRTCRERREHTNATRLTPSGHTAPGFVAMHATDLPRPAIVCDP